MVDRLRLIKRMALRACRKIGVWLPRREPARPVSMLTAELFKMLREALALHPSRFYQDRNFPDLLDVVERFLVYVAEEDGHYAGWLAEAMLLVHDLVEESRRRFPAGADGDLAWLEWMSRHPIAKHKAAER